jgi:hypothetical protein
MKLLSTAAGLVLGPSYEGSTRVFINHRKQSHE